MVPKSTACDRTEARKQNTTYIAGVRVGVQKLRVHVETNLVVAGGPSWEHDRLP